MSMESSLSDRRLPWLLRLIFNLALDGVNYESEALKDIDAPKIDAFIEYDVILSMIYRAKKVRSVASYLKEGYSSDYSKSYSAEYELAYLRRRLPIRARLQKRDINKLFIDLGGGVQ